MYCPYCGNKLPDGAVFCTYCGKELTTNDRPDTAYQDNSRYTNPSAYYDSSGYEEPPMFIPVQNVPSSPYSGVGKQKKSKSHVGEIIAGAIILVVCVMVAVAVIGVLNSDDNELAGELADLSLAVNVANAIEPTSSEVRSLALESIDHQNNGVYNIGQICDIYDSIYDRWTYVNDPYGREYFATASESAKLLKGDCEDFAILMASCIEAIGGSARVIIAQGDDGGHAYPEVYVAANNTMLEDLITMISHRYMGDTVHYHIDTLPDGTLEYWLNLDWSAAHPGGPFFNNKGDITVIYSDGYYEKQPFNPDITY